MVERSWFGWFRDVDEDEDDGGTVELKRAAMRRAYACWPYMLSYSGLRWCPWLSGVVLVFADGAMRLAASLSPLSSLLLSSLGIVVVVAAAKLVSVVSVSKNMTATSTRCPLSSVPLSQPSPPQAVLNASNSLIRTNVSAILSSAVFAEERRSSFNV